MDSGSSKGSSRQLAKQLLAWGIGVYVLIWFLSDAVAGYRGPFEGRVVDADTRQPIEGAVVLAEWSLGHVTAAGSVDTFSDAAEVLTDAQGHFYIGKKGSWNPWKNLQTAATVLIYKAGYGAAENLGWPYLKERSRGQKATSLEERKRLGPKFYHDIEFENGLPIFLLKKLTTVEERTRNLAVSPTFAPPEKTRLLIEEHNREASAIGREDALLPIFPAYK